MAWPSFYYDRLRRPPTPSTVEGALPILFFGDSVTAKFATLGLNPSDQEYLDRFGVELEGSDRRFETLGSLGARTRTDLTTAQCEAALNTMRRYFDPEKPVYRWFRPLERVLRGLGVSYTKGQVVHLDLVQESTDPTWSALRDQAPDEWEGLRRADLPFLKSQLSHLNPLAILCNGKTPSAELEDLWPIQDRRCGVSERLKWFVGRIELNGLEIKVAGWNLPLTRPTGLTDDGLTELGRLLSQLLSVG